MGVWGHSPQPLTNVLYLEFDLVLDFNCKYDNLARSCLAY